MTPSNQSPIQPGRSCSGCTMCCKTLSITDQQKPKDLWCPKCDVGKGCSIYPDRPQECVTFYCGWLTIPGWIDPKWRPAQSKIVLLSELEGNRMAAHVDPGSPMAWRDEPFYSDLKRWAAMAAPSMGQVVVQIGRRVIVILPDRDVDLGEVAADERIVTAERMTPFGPSLDAMKMKQDDPRIAGMKPGVAVVWKGGSSAD